MGDSVHAMLPDAAQGFSTIVEDVAVLAHLLHRHIDRGVSNLMKVWQDVRQPRVNRIKDWARFNHQLYTKGTDTPPRSAGQNRTTVEEISLDEVEMDMSADFRLPAFYKWAFGFDPIADVETYLEKKDKAKL